MRTVPKLAASAAVALSLSAAVCAQNLSQSFVPQLVITAPAERPVALRAVAIRTEISGSLALTSVELTLLQPEPPPARRRAAVSAARRPERGRHGDGHRRQAARRGAGRQGARPGGVRGRHARADRPGAAVGHAGQQLQAARLSDPAATRQDRRAALRGDARERAMASSSTGCRSTTPTRLPQLSLAVRVSGRAATPPLVARGDIGPPGFERAGDALRAERHAPRLPRPRRARARRPGDASARRPTRRSSTGAPISTPKSRWPPRKAPRRTAAQRCGSSGTARARARARSRAANSRCSTPISRRRATSTCA